VLPGGLGTLDETFETLTWKQLGLHDKPVALVDLDGYWQPLAALIENVVAYGFAQPRIVRMFHLARSVEEALDWLFEAPAPASLPAEPERL
ncbi:MAG TPA: LOG family protein, partial [Alphaproteobacteria bacterium]|nr:LOG family protein [Alphaproteobacteria bacterium]